MIQMSDVSKLNQMIADWYASSGCTLNAEEIKEIEKGLIPEGASRVADLEAALRWYADPENHKWGPGDTESDIHKDHGRRARMALGIATAEDIEEAKYD